MDIIFWSRDSPRVKLADNTFGTFSLNVTNVIKLVDIIYLFLQETLVQSRTMNLDSTNYKVCSDKIIEP